MPSCEIGSVPVTDLERGLMDVAYAAVNRVATGVQLLDTTIDCTATPGAKVPTKHPPMKYTSSGVSTLRDSFRPVCKCGRIEVGPA